MQTAKQKSKRICFIDDPSCKVEWQIALKNLKYEGPCGVSLTIKETTPLKTKTVTVCRVLLPNQRMQFRPKLQFFERLCSHIILLETFGCYGEPAILNIPVLTEDLDINNVHVIHLASPSSNDWEDMKKLDTDSQSISIEVSEPSGLFALVLRPPYHDVRITAIGGLFHFSSIPYAQLRIPKLSCKGEHICRLTVINIHPVREAFCRKHFSAVRQIEGLSPLYYFHCTGEFVKENTVTLPLPDWMSGENADAKLESLVVANKTDSKWEIVDSPLTTTKCTVSFKLKDMGLICMFSRPPGAVLREQVALDAICRSFDMLIDKVQAYMRLNPQKRKMLDLWIGYLPCYLEEEINAKNLEAGYTCLVRSDESEFIPRRSISDVSQLSSAQKTTNKKGTGKKTEAELIKYTFDRTLLNGSTLIISLSGDFQFSYKEIRQTAGGARQHKKPPVKKKKTESEWPFDSMEKRGGSHFEADLGDTAKEKMVPISEYLPDCYRMLDVVLKSGAEDTVLAELSKVLARYCLGAALGNPSSVKGVTSDPKKMKIERQPSISQFDFQQSPGFEGLVTCSICNSHGDLIKVDQFRMTISFLDALAFFNIDPQRELLKMQTGFIEPSSNVQRKDASLGTEEDSEDDSMGTPLPEGRALSIKSLQVLSEGFCHGLQIGKDLNIKSSTLCSIAFWTLALPLRYEETNLRVLKAWKNGCLEQFKKRKLMEQELLQALEAHNLFDLVRILKKAMSLNRAIHKRQLQEVKHVI